MTVSEELLPKRRITSLPGGYMGKMLRVDMTSGSLQDENLPEEPVLKKFIGGQALALYILMRELPLEWWYRQVRSIRITEGTPEVLRWRLAQHIIKNHKG